MRRSIKRDQAGIRKGNNSEQGIFDGFSRACRAKNDERLAAKAAAKLSALQTEVTATPAELAEKERKRAIIQAAMERARLKKEAAAKKEET